MELTTLTKLKNHLGIPLTDTAKDAKLAEIIVGVSAFIEAELNRSLGVESYTRKISGNGCEDILIEDYPIIDITALTIDGVDVSSEIISGKIHIDEESGIIYREEGWKEGFFNITISYRAGYPESGESGESSYSYLLPDDIVFAATKLAARAYERSTAEGVASAENVAYSTLLDPEIEKTLIRHRKINV